MRKLIAACAAAGLLAWSSPATAGPIVVNPEYFGFLDTQWGGSGNPNDPVAVTTITDGDVTITLGLAAQQRYFNPPLANDGDGTYYATTGANYGDPDNLLAPVGSPSSLLGATWSFDFYAEITGATSNDYAFALLYDFDPAYANDESTHGVITSGLVGNILVEESENLLFGYLAGPDIPGVLTSPTGVTTFDPYATGRYTFALRAYKITSGVANGGGYELLGETAIAVVVPEPATVALLGFGLIAAGRLRKRRS